jgi:IstB-like ATP binding protein
MRFFAGPSLLVIDEVGYLPLPAEAAAALFHVVSQRYSRGSIALTTNLGIASWGRIFDDPTVAPAMLDRLLHRSVVFNIDGDKLPHAGSPCQSRAGPEGGGRPVRQLTREVPPGDLSLVDFDDRPWWVSVSGGNLGRPVNVGRNVRHGDQQDW